MTYDLKCYDLAEHFLADEPALKSDANIAKLAQEIQTAIEDWIALEHLIVAPLPDLPRLEPINVKVTDLNKVFWPFADFTKLETKELYRREVQRRIDEFGMSRMQAEMLVATLMTNRE